MTDARRWVLASHNQGKLQELRELLAPKQIAVTGAGELGLAEPAETGLSFIENALIKARSAARETGLPALADDSGLTVDALDGAPGIYSARFAGAQATDRQNLLALLAALEAVPEPKRGARFVCALALLRHSDDPEPLVISASWRGRILQAPTGEKGFGYDPIFFVKQTNCSAAQLSRADKSKLSHRGQATQQLLAQLPVWLAD